MATLNITSFTLLSSISILLICGLSFGFLSVISVHKLHSGKIEYYITLFFCDLSTEIQPQ